MPMETFSEVIRSWPTKAAFARDIGEEYGLVHQWDRRNSIPIDYWDVTVAAAKKRKIKGVTANLLKQIRKNKNQ
jgi:hypothetical protein